ncbi:hypothetical protein [Maricaulis salignorans]|uniref:Uncharacterized protein n=1 Tax=Maricaulis salignorans TaxID=144026 RepID=A0A1G9WJ78_9PROT|nr:hypothetical protein [Maricaulis salignorans]SDM84530.1 hypothetical protein SAMN04488568_12530 [Maricaulis salignorans]
MTSKSQLLSGNDQATLRELIQVDSVKQAMGGFLRQRQQLISALTQAATAAGKTLTFPEGDTTALIQTVVAATTSAGDPVDASKANQWLQKEYGMTHHTLS